MLGTNTGKHSKRDPFSNSFYPLMAGHATTSQVERSVRKHLLNPTGFCVTPEADWPPASPAPEPDAVMLQSWHPSQSSKAVVLCHVEMGTAAAAAPGGCAALKTGGGSFIRNESIAWSSAAAGRVPLFLYHLVASNQTSFGTDSSFPAAAAAVKVSPTPACYVAEQSPQPGAWPLKLWSSDRPPPPAAAEAAAAAAALSSSSVAVGLRYRISGGPGSDEEIESSQDSQGPMWNISSTLGWALPLPHACHWGLPSVSFDDPAFGR
jgi:hypothetical protein